MSNGATRNLVKNVFQIFEQSLKQELEEAKAEKSEIL
jgi:hypothetical protein